MNKENKRPPFSTYVKSRHTGLSPFKDNFGLPPVKGTRAGRNNVQDPPARSRIPRLFNHNTQQIAQREPRAPATRRGRAGHVNTERNENVRPESQIPQVTSTLENEENNDVAMALPNFVAPAFQPPLDLFIEADEFIEVNDEAINTEASAIPNNLSVEVIQSPNSSLLMEGAEEVEDERPGEASANSNSDFKSPTDLPLLMEVVEEEVIPKYSLCHETQHIYRMKLATETARLSEIADHWAKIKEETELDLAIQDDIDAAVGQTRLLLRSKFQQFKGLIDSYETSNNIRPGDLGGFWDMVYIQVDLLDSHFAKLQKLKDNNWVPEVPQMQQKKKTKRGGKKRKNFNVKSKFREAMALRNNAEASTSHCPPESLKTNETTNETFQEGIPREIIKTPLVNKIIERARQSRRSSLGILIRTSLNGKLF